MGKIKWLVCINVFLIIGSSMNGQDVHFSQVMNFPLLINPALAGSYNQSSRAIFSARNQNLKVPNSAFSGVYNTIGASVETKLFTELTDQNTWTIGAMAISDYAGSGTLATTQAVFTSSYNLAMDKYSQSFLSIGGQIGLVNRRIFSEDLLYESQINEFEFDPKLPNLEPYIENGSKSSLTMNLGLLYQQQWGEGVKSQLGFSLYNVNKPNQFFYPNSTENVYSRMNIHGGMLFDLDDVSKIFPSVVFMKQGNFNQMNLGMSYVRELNDQVSIIAGVRNRLGDAFILMAGAKYNQFQTTFSYDLTTSSLSKSNKSVGALELNIQYLFGEEKEVYGSGKSYCPAY